MTALAAARSFLDLLDDLPSVTKPRTNTDVLLKHAAGTVRQLLAVVGAMEQDASDEAELDDVLSQWRLACPEHGVLCKGADCCCADRHQDVPRPGAEVRKSVLDGTASPLEPGRSMEGPGPAAPDLSHLPPMAGPGEPECSATSERDPAWDSAYWACTARKGHPERWHAEHHADGAPYAAESPDAAWPVVLKETGLPVWADGLPAHLGPLTVCGAEMGREPGKAALASYWVCNAVPAHAPLDHVAFAPWGHRLAGSPLARWASVHPGAGLADLPLTGTHCQCPARNGMVYHDRETCTDPVVAKLGWFAGDSVTGWPVRPLPEDVRRDGMGAQGEPATGVVAPGANTVPPRTDVPRPVDDGSHPRETEPAVGTQPVTAVGPGHRNGHEPATAVRCLCQPGDPSHPGPDDFEDCHCDCHLDESAEPAEPFRVSAVGEEGEIG